MYRPGKFVLLLAFLLMIISMSVFAQESSGAIKDVAYIVANNLGVDSNLLSELDNLGYSYDVVYESDLDSVNLDDYYVLIIGDQKLAQSSNIPINKHKSMIINSYNYYKKDSSDYQLGWSGDSGRASSPTKTYILDGSHPIADGLPSYFNAYRTTTPDLRAYILKGLKPSGVKIIAYAGSSKSDAVVAVVEKGAVYLNRRVAEEKGVFLGIVESDEWSIYSRKIFENSLEWLVNEYDLDRDGYASDIDCNDRDPLVYPENENLALNCVNDAPILAEIGDLVFYNGEKVEIKINAIDPEGKELNYNISDNNFIFDSVKNAFVWNPPAGSEGIYSLTVSIDDGELETSESFNIEIMNNPPRFKNLNCSAVINEDEEQTCILEAEDFEGDDFDFLVEGEDSLMCEIEGNVLRYKSERDYNGEASCEIAAADQYDLNEIEFNVEVVPVNDAPEIIYSSPEPQVLKIPAGVENVFDIEAIDVDEERINLNWLLDGVWARSGLSYIFNRGEGVYTLQAIASDNSLKDEVFWSIVVGNTQDFSCSEMNGAICENEEICSGEYILAKDSAKCCSKQCEKAPPSFKDAEVCGKKDSSIQVDIRNPSSGQAFETEDVISVEAVITNRYRESQNVRVDAVLYDLDRDKAVAAENTKIEIAKSSVKTASIELDIPEDSDIDNEYAIFVKVGDDICNEDYAEIELTAPSRKLSITEFDIPEEANCGDEISVEIKILNEGSSDQPVSISITNSELGINKKSDMFTLKKSSNRAVENFNLKIPDSIESGDYEITAKLNYGESLSRSVKITCENDESREVDSLEDVSLNTVSAVPDSSGNSTILIVLILTSFVSLAVLFLEYKVRK